MTTAQPWPNNIIGDGMEFPEDILANPLNWRIHPQSQQDNMRKVFRKVGWIQRVVINTTTGNLLDGHMRVMLQYRENERSGMRNPVPASYVAVDLDTEHLILATMDWITKGAVTSPEKRAELLLTIIPDDDDAADLVLAMTKDSGLLLDDALFEPIFGPDATMELPGTHHTCPNCGTTWKET